MVLTLKRTEAQKRQTPFCVFEPSRNKRYLQRASMHQTAMHPSAIPCTSIPKTPMHRSPMHHSPMHSTPRHTSRCTERPEKLCLCPNMHAHRFYQFFRP
jgi:hypothetical protein